MIDGHTFPALPLPYELNQTAFRPDFCYGTDEFHKSSDHSAEGVVQVIQLILQYGGEDQIPLPHHLLPPLIDFHPSPITYQGEL